MVWIRVDDHYDEHPKLAAVGPLGHALWLAGLAYCNRNLTDGMIPWAVAHALLNWQFLSRPDSQGRRAVMTIAVTSGVDGAVFGSGDDVNCDYVIRLLLDSGVWEERPGHYLVHDYLEYQPSKSQVLKERELARLRQGKSRSQRDSQRDIGLGSGEVTPGVTPAPVPVPVPLKKEHSAEPAGFADLWACYPGPKGPKGEAVKAFATMKPPENVVELLRKQVEYKTHCDKAGVFCPQLPHLFRWLKKERWTDEIPSNGHGRMAFEEKYPRL